MYALFPITGVPELWNTIFSISVRPHKHINNALLAHTLGLNGDNLLCILPAIRLFVLHITGSSM